MQTRIYLAVPYSHPDESVRALRFQEATVAANYLMRQAYLVYSPITHGHAIAACGGLGGNFEAWREHCLSFLRLWAQKLYVLFTKHSLPGIP